MVIEGLAGRIDVRPVEPLPPDDGTTRTSSFEVEVVCGEYSGKTTFAAVDEDVRGFVRALRALERTRRGAAVLRATSPDEFLLHIRTIDMAGHLAATGRMWTSTAPLDGPSMTFSVDIDSSMLRSILDQCEAWCPHLGPGEEPAANRPPATPEIYLGSLSEFTAGMDDDQALKFMKDVATIIRNLGYRLASGAEPAFDQLWAIASTDERFADPIEPARPRITAERLRRSFLAWVHLTFGVLPSPHVLADRWVVDLPHGDVEFEITDEGETWRLEVVEKAPIDFISRVGQHFDSGTVAHPPSEDGRLQVYFSSTDLRHPFVDQSDRT